MSDMSKPKNIKLKLTDAERYKRFLDIAKKVEASDKVEDLDKAILSLTGEKSRIPKRRAS